MLKKLVTSVCLCLLLVGSGSIAHGQDDGGDYSDASGSDGSTVNPSDVASGDPTSQGSVLSVSDGGAPTVADASQGDVSPPDNQPTANAVCLADPTGLATPDAQAPVPSLGDPNAFASTDVMTGVPVGSNLTPDASLTATSPTEPYSAVDTAFAAQPTDAAVSPTAGVLDAGTYNPQSSASGVGLSDQLNLEAKTAASDAQLAAAQAGEGQAIAGAGTTTELRDAPRLAATYGGDAADYAKMSTDSFAANDGTKFETHYYQNTATGENFEFKTKDVFQNAAEPFKAQAGETATFFDGQATRTAATAAAEAAPAAAAEAGFLGQTLGFLSRTAGNPYLAAATVFYEVMKPTPAY